LFLKEGIFARKRANIIYGTERVGTKQLQESREWI
jgi:hypothetical protein